MKSENHTITFRDEFLSEEDLDLKTMNEKELIEYWNSWLEQAQATNEMDKHLYSHGVFSEEPDSDQSSKIPTPPKRDERI